MKHPDQYLHTSWQVGQFAQCHQHYVCYAHAEQEPTVVGNSGASTIITTLAFQPCPLHHAAKVPVGVNDSCCIPGKMVGVAATQANMHGPSCCMQLGLAVPTLLHRRYIVLLHPGCPVAVANLWDVTDRDIDRFSEAVLASWLGHFEGTTLKQHLCADQSVCVSTSITNSRTACRLTSLIGAAPVCYGIPVSVSLLSQSNASM